MVAHVVEEDESGGSMKEEEEVERTLEVWELKLGKRKVKQEENEQKWRLIRTINRVGEETKVRKR